MKTDYVSYRDTRSFSKAVLDYLDDAPGLRPFYGLRAATDSFKLQIETKSHEAIQRDVLAGVLGDQYAEIGLAGASVSSQVKANIKALTAANTFTVTAGHQLNIFSGPLYTIYKILSTIKLAEDLNASAAVGAARVVPVFWLATEDHDFAEINHLNIGSKSISWNFEAFGAVGRLKTASIGNTLGKVLSSLGVMTYTGELEGLCRAAYEKNTTLSSATRYFYNALFGEYGLVILDADEPRLKQIFAPVIENEILAPMSYREVTATNRSLEERGYKVQVHPREINLFYLQENSRERIVRDSTGRFKTLNGQYSWNEDEVKAEIHDYPAHFSPNVILRPLYQEAILPNIGFIGGGAEVTYWLSLKSTFDHYKIAFPIVMLRNSALLVDEVSDKRITHLGFTATDLFKDLRYLTTAYIRHSSTKELDLRKEREALVTIMENVRVKALAIDQSLSQSSLAMLTRMQHMLEKLEKKMLKAEKNRFDVEMVQIFKIHENLFPHDSLQEREENFLPYYARYGPRLLDILKESFKVPGYNFTVLHLE